MNLTIKDLSASTELDRAAMSAVRGGADANSLVQNMLQAQSVLVPVANGASFGPGSATNIHRRRRRGPVGQPELAPEQRRQVHVRARPRARPDLRRSYRCEEVGARH